MRLVIFDFDGTIHLEDTPRLLLRLLRQDGAKRQKIRRFYLSVAWMYVPYRLGLCRQQMAERVADGLARIMRGMSRRQLEQFFEKCCTAAAPNFSPVSLGRVKAHLEAGDQIFLLSGAFIQFVALVARELGMQYWLGTEMEFRNDLCTGRIVRLLMGTEKVQALKAFLQRQKDAGLVFDMGEAYAYADSIQDLALLTLVGHPVAVNPDPGLRREAQKRGWQIIADINAVG